MSLTKEVLDRVGLDGKGRVIFMKDRAKRNNYACGRTASDGIPGVGNEEGPGGVRCTIYLRVNQLSLAPQILVARPDALSRSLNTASIFLFAWYAGFVA